MVKRFLILNFLIIALIGCGSVGTPMKYNKSKPTKVKIKQDTSTTGNNNKELKKTYTENSRFLDTNIVQLPTIIAIEQTKKETTAAKDSQENSNADYEMELLFNEAIKEFDNEDYKSSCPKFQSIVGTYLSTDSIYYEAKYYSNECLIVQNQINAAKLGLEKMYFDSKTPSEILERVIVRLGQINCLLKKDNIAQKYFDELKTRFPKSIYLKVASCEYINSFKK